MQMSLFLTDYIRFPSLGGRELDTTFNNLSLEGRGKGDFVFQSAF